MRTTLPLESRIVHAIPGRARLHVSGWSAQQQHSLEEQLRHVPGVTSAHANPLTGNVLLRFDPLVTTATRLLAATRSISGSISGSISARRPEPARRLEASQQPAMRQEGAGLERLPVEGEPRLALIALLAMSFQTQAHPALATAQAPQRIALQTCAPDHEVTQEAHARLQAWQALDSSSDNPVAERPSHEAAADTEPVVRLSERPADRAVETPRRSLLRRILRMLLAPGALALALKAASVILGLARASNPLGLALGGFELVQLLGETFARRPVAASLSSARSARYCMHCGAAL